MVQTQPKKLTFEEYLAWEDNTDNRYELIDGELIPLIPEPIRNSWIASYLLLFLVNRNFIQLRRIATHSCEVQVPVLQPGDAANRWPDLIAIQEEHLSLLRDRFTIFLEMPPPCWVAEVVSPGEENWHNDCVRKRSQYEAREIPEYWIIDPNCEQITVLHLQSGKYTEAVFSGESKIQSKMFPALGLTARQILECDETVL